MSIALFADTANLFFCIGKKYPNRKLDFKKYFDAIIAAEPGEIITLQAFGIQLKDSARSFIANLKLLGFDTFFCDLPSKNYFSLDAYITAKMMQSKADTIVLGSSSRSYEPVIDILRATGIRVVVFATGIPNEKKNVASRSMEITESLLVDVP